MFPLKMELLHVTYIKFIISIPFGLPPDIPRYKEMSRSIVTYV